jgi:hypothetical protein
VKPSFCQCVFVISCFSVATGCTDSNLVERVADQAAQIAKLEVQLQASEQTAETAHSDLKKTVTQLSSTEEELRLAQESFHKSEQANEALSKELGALRDKWEATSTQLESARGRLQAVEAERKRQEQVLDIVGKWQATERWKGDEGSSHFLFRPDQSGNYRRSISVKVSAGYTEEEPDYQISYSRTATPGVYYLDGKTKPEKYVNPKPSVRVSGVFRISPDGQSAVLENWDAHDSPRKYIKASGDKGE